MTPYTTDPGLAAALDALGVADTTLRCAACSAELDREDYAWCFVPDMAEDGRVARAFCGVECVATYLATLEEG